MTYQQTQYIEVDDDIVPLTKQQAEQLRAKHKQVKPSDIVIWQFVGAFLLIVLVALISFDLSITLSVAYGCLVVILPTLLLVYKIKVVNQIVALKFLMWNLIKQMLMVTLLLVALVFLNDWLHLTWILLGVLVTIKVYWLSLFYCRRTLNKY